MTQEAGVPGNIYDWVERKIDAAVAKLARSGMLRNASISGGGLTIKGGFLRVLFPESLGGGTGVYFGDLVDEASGDYIGTGLLGQGPDSSDNIFAFHTMEGGGTRAALYTGGTHRAISTATEGVGIARPFLAGGFARARYADWGVSTTSATFETLWEQTIVRQHPELAISIRASMDTAGTTGETRILVDGVPFGGVFTEEFVANYRLWGPSPAPGGHMSNLTIEIQGRRTSATGALRVEPRYWRSSGVG